MEMTKEMLYAEIKDLAKNCDNIECLKLVYYLLLHADEKESYICNNELYTIQF